MILPNRLLLISYYTAYGVSLIILVISSTSKSPVPAWGGSADVGTAILIALLGFVIFGRGKNSPRFEIGHRAALNIVPSVLLVLWVLHNAFDFNILLPGLAWRIFFFLHILPYGATLWNSEASNE